MPQPSFAPASSIPVAHRSLGRPRRGRNCGWADAALSSAQPTAIETDPVFSMDGRGLSRFGRALHLIVMANELRGGRGAYRLAHGGFARRGFCFGPPRWDLSREDSAAKRRIFADILDAAAESNGPGSLPDRIRRTVCDAIGRPERHASVLDHADEIATALSSGYGRARIASLHRDALQRAEARVRRLERSASPLARPFIAAHDGALCIADFIIAFGAPDPLVRFLTGKAVRLDGGEQKLTRTLDAQVWITFLGATRPYCGTAEGATEMRRRMINVAGCVGRLDWRPAIEAKADAIRLAHAHRRPRP